MNNANIILCQFKVRQRLILILTAVVLLCFTLNAHAIGDKKIVVSVSTDTTAKSVTFTWGTQADGGTVQILRRDMGKVGTSGDNDFVLLGTVSYPDTTFTDTTADLGKTYEYRILRPEFTTTSGTSYSTTASYVAVSLDAPLVDDRGTLLLVVDTDTAGQLVRELECLELDLAGDGWTVKRLETAPRGVGDPVALKAAIVDACAADSTIKALYLFGRIPRVYSGWMNPDGHDKAIQETDLYYADIDYTWTDIKTYGDNLPGDGSFDYNTVPSPIELMVGRVDFGQMTAHRKNEIEYLRDYIQKSHAWRHAERAVPYKAFNASDSYLFMEHNWERPMFGSGYDKSVESFQPACNEQEYVWGVDFGSYNGYNPDAYGGVNNKIMFMMNFGSYKQHWATQDNPMRALLCQPDWGLTCSWGSRPAWHMHHMAAGMPVGYSALRTVNNGFDGVEYTPPGSYSFLSKYVSLNLMGDPTLRMHPVLPAEDLTVTATNTAAKLVWSAPSDSSRIGFHVYRSTSKLGPYTHLTSSPLSSTSTTYSDTSRPAGDVYYQVRAIADTSAITGNYQNQSQGVFALLHADNMPNHSPVATAPSTLQAGSDVPCRIEFPGSDEDGDTLIPIVVSNPTNGQLHWNGNSAYYVSGIEYTGSDSFTYRLFDGTSLSEPVTRTINVSSIASDLLIGWRFGAPDDGVEQDLSSTTTNDAVLPCDIVIGSDLKTSTTASYNKYALYCKGANSTGLDENDYLEWKVAPVAGNVQSLSSLVFFHAANVSTSKNAALAPYNIELCWSIDGFVTSQAVTLDQTAAVGIHTGQNGGRLYSADLSGITELQNTANAITFRLYVWNTDYSILGCSGDNQAQSSYDLVVSGSCTTEATEKTLTFTIFGEDKTLPVKTYGTDQDGEGQVVSNDRALQLLGNRWQMVDLSAIDIQDDTVLCFDFSSTAIGDIHGIGFDKDNNISSAGIFQVYGTQDWGQDAGVSFSGDGTQHFEIPVGQFISGSYRYLCFAMDHDVTDPTGESVFSNIEIKTSSKLSINVFGEDQSLPVESYTSTQDGDGDVVVKGSELQLTGNRWQKIDLGDVEIQSDTVLSFDFSSSQEGEIHAIGFANDDSVDSSALFQVYGTQDWGLNAGEYYNTDGVQHFEILVGEFMSGGYKYICFAMDHDVTDPTGESVFSNIVIRTK